jgi:hypothetical protein
MAAKPGSGAGSSSSAAAEAFDLDSVPVEIMREVSNMMPSELTLEDAAVISVIKTMLQLRKSGQVASLEVCVAHCSVALCLPATQQLNHERW